MATKRVYELPFGAHVLADGRVRFRLWAPAQQRVGLELDGATASLPMLPFDQGWHELITYDAKLATRYRFVLQDDLRVPDPASRFQPDDVHGASEVIDPSNYDWRDSEWRGRAWEDAVVYELHIGAFTAAGTFRAAIDKLDHLVALGVTALEIMPVADFPGRRNWGYDGAFLYAPDSSYGRPEDFKALIDAAHARGLMVLLDVVYNHFGPDGNYLASYAPQFFSERHKTPWGAALNYDGPQSRSVRDFMIHNALYWLAEFHLDGLRLDAVHAIADDSDKHLLVELAERVRAFVNDRPIHLIVENEDNHAHLLKRDGTALLYSAQWNDDVHHVLHTAATNEASGYYQDYLDDTIKLGRALAQGFAYQGELMSYRNAPRGEASTELPPTAFVAFIQNHDQIGNRAYGERIAQLASDDAVRAIAAVYLLLPQVPMLFMGEEWNATQPFAFFCDFSGDLAQAVSKGRRAEFARFSDFQDADKRARIPDPQAETTFMAAKLQWHDLQNPQHSKQLEWYRRILQVRQRDIRPLLADIRRAGSYVVVAPGAVLVTWPSATTELILAANLSNDTVDFPLTTGRVLWQQGVVDERHFAPWAVRWSLVQAED
jgi:malto-oligosyltrehalose trehalohydrolase